tara:strand:+ start:583 stop:1188 length:606 start_codon:yes stop_codon:yes gene_type:complete
MVLGNIVHSITSTILFLLSTISIKKNIYWYSGIWLSFLYYFIDSILSYQKKEYIFIIHHIISTGVFYNFLYLDNIFYYSLVTLLCEASSIFINFRFYLKEKKKLSFGFDIVSFIFYYIARILIGNYIIFNKIDTNNKLFIGLMGIAVMSHLWVLKWYNNLRFKATKLKIKMNIVYDYINILLFIYTIFLIFKFINSLIYNK